MAPTQVYFQTLPFLTLLSFGEVEAVVRNAEALLELHERIAERIDVVEEEFKWREAEGEGESAVELGLFAEMGGSIGEEGIFGETTIVEDVDGFCDVGVISRAGVFIDDEFACLPFPLPFERIPKRWQQRFLHCKPRLS